jgi:putative endonuclease
MRSRLYFVYIVANGHRTLYTGVTSDLERRVQEHRARRHGGFSSRYGIDRLVYFETTPDVRSAIAREKQIKGWVRRRKLALIESLNPEWKDLGPDRASERDSSVARAPSE